jgi:hypothetical protein
LWHIEADSRGIISKFPKIVLDTVWRVVPHCGEMRDEDLDAEVKTRAPKQHKEKLREIAISRHLKLSDIVREAIREKIEREVRLGEKV